MGGITSTRSGSSRQKSAGPASRRHRLDLGAGPWPPEAFPAGLSAFQAGPNAAADHHGSLELRKRACQLEEHPPAGVVVSIACRCTTSATLAVSNSLSVSNRSNKERPRRFSAQASTTLYRPREASFSSASRPGRCLRPLAPDTPLSAYTPPPASRVARRRPPVLTAGCPPSARPY
jgi:hypothetical protein